MIVLDRDRARRRALDLAAFVDASPMPHLAAAESVRRLAAAGFTELSEADAWELEPGRGYYALRNGSTVIAFRLGREAPSASGVNAIAAHVDSPNLRLKPKPDVTASGYRQLGVEVYGGAIVASWSDRDLGLSGRVLVETGGGVESRLVRIDRPLARVANLAIHLNRGVNEEGLKLDKQKHLPPLFGLVEGDAGDEQAALGLVAAELGVDPGRIVGHDLGLHDLTPSRLGGLDEEFLFAPRLDNLGSSHAGLAALLAAGEDVPDAPASSWLLALYDHEECGSRSLQGALGTFFADVIRRMATGHPAAGPSATEEISRAFARSYLISADMAHAVHPNYAEYHEPGHRPALNQGPVIKRNENQRYATDGESAARFRRLCRAAGFEPQEFVNRSDLPCGSTIGPLTSAMAGIKTVDVGNPMLSMHSAREMAGAWDHDLMIEAMRRVYV